MNGSWLYNVALFLYLLSFFLNLISLLFQKDTGRWGTIVLAAGFLLHSVGIILRGFLIGMVPVTNTYETLVFYSWVFVLAYLSFDLFFFRIRTKLRSVAMSISFVAFGALILAASPLFSSTPIPLMPALQSYWLALHVSFTVAGEGFFALAFFFSLLYLWRFYSSRKREEPESSSLDILDRMSYRAIALGFPLFTIGGLLFGSVWAKQAWGSYWTWDPKETFTLVTWLVYVGYLHVRLRYGWKRSRAAWIAVGGFLLALFTFAGVNYLLSGLHSYR